MKLIFWVIKNGQISSNLYHQSLTDMTPASSWCLNTHFGTGELLAWICRCTLTSLTCQSYCSEVLRSRHFLPPREMGHFPQLHVKSRCCVRARILANLVCHRVCHNRPEKPGAHSHLWARAPGAGWRRPLVNPSQSAAIPWTGLGASSHWDRGIPASQVQWILLLANPVLKMSSAQKRERQHTHTHLLTPRTKTPHFSWKFCWPGQYCFSSFLWEFCCMFTVCFSQQKQSRLERLRKGSTKGEYTRQPTITLLYEYKGRSSYAAWGGYSGWPMLSPPVNA